MTDQPGSRSDDALELLRYFVAFHTPGDMPPEFAGGQMAQRLEQAKALIRAPRSERGERWLVAKENAIAINGLRHQLSYIVVADWPTFSTFEDAVVHIKKHELPLGWVAMKESQLHQRPAERNGS